MSDHALTTAGTLLLVEDDTAYCSVLGNSLRRRGFRVSVAHSLDSAYARLQVHIPALAILDLNLNGESSLALIPELREHNPTMQILILTGYASVATAVEAIKLGANAYLVKPANIDDILRAMISTGTTLGVRRSPPSDMEQAMVRNYRLVLRECAGNVSAAARKLGMHRRSLQRKLKRDSSE